MRIQTRAVNFLFPLLFCLPSLICRAQTSVADEKDWVKASNAYTKLLIDIDEKYSPEFGSDEGHAFYDTLVAVPTLENTLKRRKEIGAAISVLKAAKARETSLMIRQDLDILIRQAELESRKENYSLQKEVSFINPTRIVFGSLQTLLDDQTPVERRAASVIRLRKYAGMEPGYAPITSVLQERTAGQIRKTGMIYPSRQFMEVELSRNASIRAGIEGLFKKYSITGWEPSYTTIKKQLEEYDAWVREQLLPKGRSDFKLPAEKYRLALEDFGIDIPPAQIAKMAHVMFTDIQRQMKPIAAVIAKKYHLASSDYRDVIRFLKQKQLIPVYFLTCRGRHIQGQYKDPALAGII